MESETLTILFKGTISSLKSVFQVYLGDTNTEMSDLHNPLTLKRFQDTLALKKHATLFDQLLLESYKETLKYL